jgi:anti-sigma regulatory factor (Ser/Thr protein kinase)
MRRVELRAMDAQEAAAARAALRAELQGWECEQIEDALLVFSELVTNAVLHAGGAPRIDVVHDAPTLRFEIHDRSPGAPHPRPSADGTGGFGLRIVEQISVQWGWDPTADGKVVWSTVPCCPPTPG